MLVGKSTGWWCANFCPERKWLEKIAFQAFHDQQKKLGFFGVAKAVTKNAVKFLTQALKTPGTTWWVAAGGIFAEAKSGVARGTWVSWVVLVLSLEHDRKIRPKMGAEDLWEGRTHTIGGVLAVQERCVCWAFLCPYPDPLQPLPDVVHMYTDYGIYAGTMYICFHDI